MANLIETTIRDRTVRVFDRFYNFNINIEVGQYDVVYSYMRTVCENDQVAQQFTSMLFRIAQQLDISPSTLLKELQGKNGIQMNQTMAYYFNSFKSKTSLYGFSVKPAPNQSVARNIVL